LFRNYLVTALRGFTRHKLYSVINIAGLTVGLACAIFIVLFLRDELSYDAWVPDSEHVYRVESTFKLPGRDPDFFPVAPFPLTPTMQAEIPEVVAHTHFIPEQMTAQVGDRLFPVTVDGVDPNFFQVIKLPLVQGDPATALPGGDRGDGKEILRHRQPHRQDRAVGRIAQPGGDGDHARPAPQHASHH
jgi:putative ABC transport system permease protein